MNVGLYFGSFNPIHVGHLIIANHVLSHTTMQQIWFVVSPHNPLKESSSLLHERHRLHLVRLATEDEPRFKASDIEFSLPRPSYTIDTLTHLSELYPKHRFSIIMGSDSQKNIRKWKNYEILLRQYPIIVYHRPGYEPDNNLPGQIEFTNAPLLDISSTYIRQLLKEKKSIRYLVHDAVLQDILANHYYR
jgi:nicotinate (nicotinamide) nucleotide adenylyltransferase